MSLMLRLRLLVKSLTQAVMLAPSMTHALQHKFVRKNYQINDQQLYALSIHSGAYANNSSHTYATR